MIKNKKLKNISFEGIIADLAVIINLFVYEYIVQDFEIYAEPILCLMGIFQFFALYAIFLGGTGAIFESVEKFKILRPFKILVGLFLFLSIGGFFWLGIPTDAIGTKAAWIAFSINIFVVIIGGWIALGISLQKTDLNKFDIIVKYVGPSLYLIFSESLLLYSVEFVPRAAIVFAVMISYFPIRFLMMIKPPVSNFEILSGFTAFVFFIFKILGYF